MTKKKTLRDLFTGKIETPSQPKQSKITEVHTESHSVTPRVAMQGMASTSGYERLMYQQSLLVNQTQGYNPDIIPWQSPVLQYPVTNITNREVREMVFEFSEFIQKQTTRIFHDIITRGWKIFKEDETPKDGESTNSEGSKDETDEKTAVDSKEMPDEKSEEKSDTDEKPDKDSKEKNSFGSENEDSDPKKDEMSNDPNAENENETDITDEFPTLTNDMKVKLIEGMSKGVFIDSTFITLFGYNYRLFSSNDVFRIFGDSKRNPTEVYFNYPADEIMKWEGNSQEEELNYRNEKVGFLLQDCPDYERKARVYQTPDKIEATQTRDSQLIHEGRSVEKDKNIYRECVQIRPLESIKSAFGKSMLLRQGHTALGLIYIEFFAMFRAHKGGKDRFLVYPANASEEYKSILMKEMVRGMLTRGTAIGYEGDPVQTKFMLEESPIPDLNEERIKKILTSDAIISRQLSEGTPESGALGGSAPEASERIDEHTKDMYYLALEKVLRDIYWVFYGIPRYKHETESETKENKKELKVKNGSTVYSKDQPVNVKLEPAYKIKFLTPELDDPDKEKLEDPGDPDDKTDSVDPKKGTTDKSKTEPKPKKETNSKKFNDKKALKPSSFFETHSTANVKGQTFKVYRGNLFNPGEYKYPVKGESDPFDIEKQVRKVKYNVKDIKELTKNPVNIKDLEFTHSNDHLSTGLGDNWFGFVKIIGFDNKTNTDITDIYILEDKDQKLKEMGVITQNSKGKYSVEVSPFFVRRPKSDGGQKLLVLNTAIVDPRNDTTMSEYSGLGKTNASEK